MPPMPLIQGSTTPKAKAVATAASTALPPASRIAAPAFEASTCCETTMPPRPVRAGLLSCQVSGCARLIRLLPGLLLSRPVDAGGSQRIDSADPPPERPLHEKTLQANAMLTPVEAAAPELSLRIGLWAVAGALPIAIALAYLLARGRFRGRALLAALVDLPLVLPPVVTGYALLLLFGRHGPIGV